MLCLLFIYMRFITASVDITRVNIIYLLYRLFHKVDSRYFFLQNRIKNGLANDLKERNEILFYSGIETFSSPRRRFGMCHQLLNFI